MDLDAYRAAAQAYATELNGAHLRRFAGLSARWDPVAIHARHVALWSDDAIEGLRDAGSRPLLRFAVEARLHARLAPVDAARAEAEAGEDLAGLTAALAAEEDPVARVELGERRLDATVRRLTPLAAEAVEQVRAEARALGWPSARAMWAELQAVDLGALAAEAEALLRATAPPELPAWVQARHDLPRWRAVGRPPAPSLAAVLAALDLAPRFAIEDAPRPGASPRAFCAAVRVPDDVHLVAGDGGALLHEAGHALHLTHRPRKAPFEDRHLVDRATSEGFAFLLEELGGADPLRPRRLAAALLHDLDVLDAGAHPGLRDRYGNRMAAATGLDWPTAPWLTDADPLLSSADYLRGLGRAHALREQLGGPGWHERPGAGRRLAALMAA
ncbi:MAG: hypothetical protein HZB46_16040 [Solirubrobacterales bacterium]|nr:hypothetical protein [Solirubrobacterales bacterium]